MLLHFLLELKFAIYRRTAKSLSSQAYSVDVCICSGIGWRITDPCI